MDVDVFEQTSNPRILRVRGSVLCYEVLNESLEPVARMQTWADAQKYLELLKKYEFGPIG